MAMAYSEQIADCAAAISHGWPKSRAKYGESDRDGILSENAGPSRAIWASPVGITSGMA